MIESFYLSGGFFDGSSNGFIGKVTLEFIADQPKIGYETELIYAPDETHIHVPNKGFTGICLFEGRIWACHSNQIIAIDTKTYKPVIIIDDPLFNDLHHLHVDHDGITVVNTGLESIDSFSLEGKFKHRTLLSNSERTDKRVKKCSDFRVAKTDPHFFHANHCFRKDDGNFLVTFARQRRVVDMDTWEWASPELPAPPHDGFISYYDSIKQDCLWLTTVPGIVYAIKIDTFEIIDSWDVVKLGAAPGWTRGLSVLKHGLLVGTTQIRPSTQAYYQGWTKEDVKNSLTTLTYIPFRNESPTLSIDILSEENSKIYSIIKNTEL